MRIPQCSCTCVQPHLPFHNFKSSKLNVFQCFFSVGLVSSPVNGLWSWAPQQDPVLPLGWVPVQNSAWSQPAGLGDIPAQNLPAGATSLHTLPWDSGLVSQEL